MYWIYRDQKREVRALGRLAKEAAVKEIDARGYSAPPDSSTYTVIPILPFCWMAGAKAVRQGVTTVVGATAGCPVLR